MGTLLPEDLGFPDHERLRSPFDAVSEAAPKLVLLGFAIAVAEGPTDLVKPDMRLVGRPAIEMLSTGTANITPLVGIDGKPIFPQAFTAAEFDALKRP